MEQNLWMWVVLVVIVVGALLLLSAILRPSKTKYTEVSDVQHKDGLPITPRDERTLPEQTATAHAGDMVEPTEDALSSMAAAATSSTTVAQPTAWANVQNETITTDEPTTFAPTQDDIPYVYESSEQESSRFEQNSPLLDKHLTQQEAFDRNNDPLLGVQDTITIVIAPRDNFAGLSGKTVLKIVHDYALKYGVMNMFHRYEHESGSGDLWFSMLGVTDEGVQSFDLNVLAESRFNSLLLFLSLPHPHALRGFDSMKETAQMLAHELQADLCDEHGCLLDDVELGKLRAIAANYQ